MSSYLPVVILDCKMISDVSDGLDRMLRKLRKAEELLGMLY